MLESYNPGASARQEASGERLTGLPGAVQKRANTFDCCRLDLGPAKGVAHESPSSPGSQYLQSACSVQSEKP